MEIKTVDNGVVSYNYRVFHYEKDTITKAWVCEMYIVNYRVGFVLTVVWLFWFCDL